MAIVKMKKFHLMLLNSYRENLLRELQIFRNIQFEDVCEVDDFESQDLLKFKRIAIEDEISKYEDQMNQCTHAIDLIGKHTSQLTGIKALIEGLPNYTFEEMEKKATSIDFDKEYEEVKSLGDQLASIDSSISKRKELIKELEAVENLDISFASLNQLKAFKGLVGGVSNKLVDIFNESMQELEFSYYEEIGVYKDERYFFIIYDKREEENVLESFRIGNVNIIKSDSDKLPRERIAQLKGEIEEFLLKKDDLCKLLGSKHQELSDFKIYFEYLGNLKVRALAQEEFMESGSVSVLSGYCPDFEIKRFEEKLASVCKDTYTVEFEDVDKNDPDVPIILKNNRIVRAFESITSTYALPKYNEVDPTPLYAPIYALFFGMMSADVGYGTVLLLLTTLGLKICNFTPSMKKNVKFFQLIGISTTAWGFLYGSYFGASIPGMWRLFDLSKDFMTILIISIIMGGIHLGYGLLIKAYMQIRDGQYLDMFFDVIAWFLTLGGIICLLLSLAGIVSAS